MSNKISIKGARVHNLKNIDVEIPRDKLVVVTGISGSGKSSLAFDTVYAEGQRRYVESLSAYARQFLGVMDKPDVDHITGLSPAIAIDQKTTTNNPRSTVGTMTEIYDLFRILYARVGVPHCPECGEKISRQTPKQMVDKILKIKADTQFLVISPLIKEQKGQHKKTIDEARKAGYTHVRIDGLFYTINEAEDLNLDKHKPHTIELVVDKMVTGKKLSKPRLEESIKTALDLANGSVVIHNSDEELDKVYSEHWVCPHCQISLPEIEPRNFSFNSPHGACGECAGLGTKLKLDEGLIMPNKKLGLAEGAIRPWSRNSAQQTYLMRSLEAMAQENGFSTRTPVKDLKKKDLEKVLYGTGEQLYDLNKIGEVNKGKQTWAKYEGVVPNLEKRYKETDSEYLKSEIERYMRTYTCPVCKGCRLKDEYLAVTVGERNISEITSISIDETVEFFKKLKLGVREQKIASQLMEEVKKRLSFLQDVGLTYLSLNRSANTLAGGESQRIRLATQMGAALTGVIYVLDEPSIGLHQRDNQRLLKTLEKLRDLGNTVIVVEHDEDTIRIADYVIDVGPGAGKYGGKIVAKGTLPQILKDKKSLTAAYLSGKEKIKCPKEYRKGNKKKITIKQAEQFNLKKVNAEIPLGCLVCVTGVSGSGKSTLITDILAKALAAHFHGAKDLPGKHKEMKGLENLDKIIHIDQSPIGRTPRSNAATYTGVFTYIRDLFTQVPEAKMRGYKAGHFSFNVKGGRCEACQGDGAKKIAMHFLPDVYVKCDQCHGKRFNQEVLEIHYKGKTIADVLDMTVEEAFYFFADQTPIKEKLKTLREVGLEYICLGQSATTLSGGEAQRVKLATELSRRATGKTLYILDEPTTGLHFFDVKKLLDVLNRLVDKGNSVLIVEHNLEVVKCADHVIDMGPDGGDKGGYIVAQGTPKEVSKVKESYTGQYLKKLLK